MEYSVKINHSILGEMDIAFEHFVGLGMTLSHEDRQCISCTIGTSKLDEYPGTAILNPRDLFDHDKGRRVALANAIEHLSWLYPLTKEERREIWEKFFEAEHEFMKQLAMKQFGLVEPAAAEYIEPSKLTA